MSFRSELGAGQRTGGSSNDSSGSDSSRTRTISTGYDSPEPDGGSSDSDSGGGSSSDSVDSGENGVDLSGVAADSDPSDSPGSGSDSDSGDISDTAIGASYRDPTLEQAAEDADGEDAADTVAAGGIASAINFGGLTEESVAEDAEATGTTGSLSNALDRAFNPGSGGGDESQQQPSAQNQNQNQNQPVQTVVERIREPIPTSFEPDSGPGSGVIVAVAVGLIGLAAIAFAGGDG